MHLLWHCFNNFMQNQNIYFNPVLHTFLAEILYWWQKNQTIPSVFSSSSQRLLMGLKSGLSGGGKFKNMLYSFTTRARWILALLSWIMPWAIREEKIHWWDHLVIQYIQEICWLAVPRPDQLKQPQIITLKFADLNQNDGFFLARQCISFKSLSCLYKQYSFTSKTVSHAEVQLAQPGACLNAVLL